MKRIPFALILALFPCLGLLVLQAAFEKGPKATMQNAKPRIERMVDVGGRKLHCRVFGQGSPVVVLLSGFRAPQEYWDPIVPAISEIATVVTYDRPGYGKSEIGTKSCDGRQAMRELKTLLEALGISEPSIIVGHSLGGRFAQIFASLFPDRTAGLVLLDTGFRDPRLPWRADGGRPAENAAEKNLEAPPGMTAEAECNDLTWRQTEAIISLPRVPLTVVSAGRVQTPPWLSPEERQKAVDLRKLDQEALVKMIPGGRHIVLPDSGHNVIAEATEDVIRAIRDMIQSLRR